MSHRAGERFPLWSTFKVLAAAAILKTSESDPGLLQRRVRYQQSQLVDYSPITQKHVASGMTVAELCAAAIQYSDNTAGNLLIRMLGGPPAVTAFAKSLGDPGFRLDRWETALNSAIPGDPRDTSTPAAMRRSLQHLVLGEVLKPQPREQLRTWLLGNTTGGARIKAGIPSNWKIGDKTGGGSYGTANDIAVLWPPQTSLLIVAIYTTRREKEAKARNDIIAATARVVVDWFDPTDNSNSSRPPQESSNIELHHVAEAINYRAFDRKLFGWAKVERGKRVEKKGLISRNAQTAPRKKRKRLTSLFLETS